MNDMCAVSEVLGFILFADDTKIFFSHKNLNFIEKTLNEGLLNLTDWCRVNKLSINIIKSNFMVFKPRQKRENLNIKLEFKQCTILGVIVDENLSWKLHIGNILSKVSKSIDIIYKASLCLPTSTFFTLCYSLFYPYLLYCIMVWGFTYPSTLKHIALLQIKVVRFISRSTFNAHTEPIFRQLKIQYVSILNRKDHVFVQDRPSSRCSWKITSFSSSSHSYYARQCISFTYPFAEQISTVCVMFPRT